MGSSWRTRSLQADLVLVGPSGEAVAGPVLGGRGLLQWAPSSSRAATSGVNAMASLAKASASMLLDLALRRKIAAHVVRLGWKRPGRHDGPRRAKEHGDGQPGRSGRLHHHLEDRARRGPFQGGLLQRSQAPPSVGTALRLAITFPSPLSTRAVCSLAIPRSKPTIRRSIISNLPVSFALPADPVVGTISPRPQGGRLAAAPTHVLQTAPASWAEPLPSSGSSVARPSGGSQNREAKGALLSPGGFSAPPQASRDCLIQPRDRRSVVDPPTGVLYMAGGGLP